MKLIIKLFLVAIIALVSYGYYIKITNFEKGNAYIGIGVMALVFILMPLFLIDRYRNKKLKSFIYKHEENSRD